MLLVDLPLLVEVGALEGFDRIVVVFVKEEIQLARLMERDRLSLDEAREALEAQMPLREKLAFADHVLDNNGSLEETQLQVEAVWRELLSLAHAGVKESAATRKSLPTPLCKRGARGDLETR